MRFLLFTLVIMISSVSSVAQNKVCQTENFVIHYELSTVPANTDPKYVSLEATHATDSIPYYIQDMGLYLQAAFDKYASLKLIPKWEYKLKGFRAAPPSDANPKSYVDSSLIKIDIYVEDIGTSDGETPPHSNYLKFNTYIKPERGMIAALALQKACAHELLHHVTKSYYSVLATYSTRWWWETLATQADRVVFPHINPYEAEQYASDKLSIFLHRSWDDCTNDSTWYKSGGFLSYLCYYRPGIKADFREIFLRPSNDKTSYVRTVLNNYSVNELGAKSIGWEYHDYLQWCYENKGFAFIDTSGLNLQSKHVVPVRLDDKFRADTLATNVPYMAAKIFRIVNQEIKKKTIVVKNSTKTQNIVLYVYACQRGKRAYLKQISVGDSLVYHYQDKAQWLDVLSINYSNDQEASPEIVVIDAIMAEGDYKGKVDFADDNTKMKSKYKITVSELHIIIDENNQATGTVEFHMEYPKDGMLAVCSELQGKVDPYGNFLIKGRVKETNYPKCKDNCCTYDLIKQGSPCFKVNGYLNWYFGGKVKLNTQKKDIEGKIVVTTATQRTQKDKATLVFSVSSQTP